MYTLFKNIFTIDDLNLKHLKYILNKTTMSATTFFHVKYFIKNKKTKKTYKLINFLIFSLFTLLVSSNLCSQNLITNGDFERGTVGFITNGIAYKLITPPFTGTTAPG